jgi:HEAT repeat protein
MAHDTVVDLFTRTAQEQGLSYRVGADLLHGQGKSIAPLLQEKATSPDWRERDLARYLLLKRDEPERVAIWSKLFAYGTQPTFATDDAILIPLNDDEMSMVKKAGKVRLRDGMAIVDREAVPLLLDYVRGHGGPDSGGHPRDVVWDRVLDVLARLAPADAAPALVAALERTGGRAAGVEEALARIGHPAVPILHDAVQNAPLGIPRNDTAESQRDWRRIYASPAVARTLGRIGDKHTPRLLLEKLDTIQNGEQIEAYCAALAALRAHEAMPAVFHHTLRAAEQDGRESSYFHRVDYRRMRQAMLTFGPRARDFLRDKASQNQTPLTAACGTGLLYELDHPEQAAACYLAAAENLSPVVQDDLVDLGANNFWHISFDMRGMGRDVPVALRIERGGVYGHPCDLLYLAKVPNNPLAFEVAAAWLLRENRPDYDHVVLALAESGNPKAPDILRRILESPQKQQVERLASAAVAGLLLLGDRQAVPVLEALLKRADEVQADGVNPRAQAVELARAVLPVLKGESENTLNLLESDQQSIRSAAASHLARKGDVRAIPVLLSVASASGPRRVDHRNDLVRLGKSALPVLKKELEGSSDARVRLVCESVILRINRPDLAAKLVQAAVVRNPGFFGGRAGPDVGTFQAAGTRIADALGRESIALLEEIATFNDEPPGTTVAIFSLARFKEERSIPVVSAAGASVEVVRGGNPVAHALRQFGAKGIEAAKAIPAPDPNKDQFASRAGRHRVGTEVLAMEQDIRGVDNILDGLRLPLPDRQKRDSYQVLARTKSYLRFAAKYQDQRLIEPLLSIAEAGEKELALLALEALAAYEDPRIVPLALEWLGPGHRESYANPALRVLVRQVGPDVVPLLVGRLGEERDEATRHTAARALGNLGAYGSSIWSAGIEEKREREKADADAINPALDALLQGLRDPCPTVTVAAAEALVDWSSSRQFSIRTTRPVKPLAKWAATRTEVPWKVVRYLVASNDAVVAPALLAVYRASNRKDMTIAEALGELRHGDAIPDLTRGLDAVLTRERGYDGKVELTALGNISEAGIEKVHEKMMTATSMQPRCRAAEVLGQHRFARAYSDMAALFEAVAETGPNAELRPWYDTRPADTKYRDVLTTLAENLTLLDPQAAHSLFSKMFVMTEDKELIEVLAVQVRKLEEAHPELKSRPVPALPTGAQD